jgi:hypothetical protein
VINLRYHIVSIAAVFLALGLGVALGSSFIDGAIVSRLESNVDNLQGQRDDLQAEVAQLSERIDALEARQAQFELLATPLIGGDRLAGVPVMLIVANGVADDLVARVRASVVGAGAAYDGALFATDRFDLDQDGDRALLAELLGVASDDPGQLRSATFDQLAEELLRPALDPPATVAGGDAAAAATELVLSPTLQLGPGPSPPANTLLGELVGDGFFLFDPSFSLGEDLAVLPRPQTRYVVASGEDADLATEDALTPLLESLAAHDAGTVPAVAADVAAALPPPSAEPAPASGLVGDVRNDATLSAEVSTVDHVGTDLAGLLAVLAALDQVPAVGHYGLASDAVNGLLPPP